MRDPELLILAWLLTWAVHGTLLLSAAWLLSRRLGPSRHRLRELCWRTAVVGSLVTASAQVGLRLEPLGGRVMLQQGVVDTVAEHLTPAPEVATERSLLTAEGSMGGVHGIPTLPASPLPLLPLAGRVVEPAHAHPGAAGSRVAADDPASGLLATEAAGRWSRPALAGSILPADSPGAAESAASDLTGARALVLLAALLALAAPGLARIGFGWRRLAEVLAGRVRITAGPLHDELERLARRAGLSRTPRIELCPSLSTPLTTGFVRPRICLPPRARELSRGARRAMLAHELAHVARRDPAWSLFLRTLQALLPFQPLLRLARRELDELAELACDDAAVELGAGRIQLARCLTEVAAWLVPPPRAALEAPGMAGSRAALGARVRRLLREEHVTPRRVPRSVGFFLGGALGLVALVAPGAADAFDVDDVEERELTPETRPAKADAVLDRADTFSAWREALVAAAEPEDSADVSGELTELVDLLESELGGLELEVLALRGDLRSRPVDAGLARALDAVEERLADLRARRDRLRALVPLVLATFRETADATDRFFPAADSDRSEETER